MKKLLSGLLLALMPTACSRPDPSNERARAIWLKHERVLEAAIQGEKTYGSDTLDAAVFFEGEGFKIPANTSTVIDWVPTSETGPALKSLRQWYRVNGSRLYCDPESGKVRIKP